MFIYKNIVKLKTFIHVPISYLCNFIRCNGPWLFSFRSVNRASIKMYLLVNYYLQINTL